MRPALLLLGALAAGCDAGAGGDALDFPGPGPGGKADAFGRSLVGVAAPYEPDPSLADEAVVERLRTDLAFRREKGWQTAYKVLEPVPLLGVAEVEGGDAEVSWPEEDVPSVPRWQTWYGLDDVQRMFQHLYEQLGEAGRRARAPFGAEAIAAAMVWNAAAAERSDRWPLDRYLDHVRELGDCPEELSADACAALVQDRAAGAVTGTARILYSPGAVGHYLEQYDAAVRCLERLDALSLGEEPASDENFTACFAEELPPDAALVKAQWVRADLERDLPVFDTDGDALRRRLAQSATWNQDGDRRVDPAAEDIYTIRLRDGSVYRLAGLHIMTKELRHWQWVTLWWSDRPDVDFGADRPERFAALPPVWRRYKMCTVTWFDEEDPELATRLAELPTLADAASATGGAPGEPSWCSNPYIEHGHNNARTNCIGCHQHGGSTVAFDDDGDGDLDPLDLEAILRDERRFPNAGRSQIRELFPADYLFSFNRVDDLSGLLRREIEFFDHADRAVVQERIDAILALAGDPEAGAERFGELCAGCHGPEGGGTPLAPDLGVRVPGRDDVSLVQTLLQGRGAMPAWGERLSDPELADVFALLRGRFGGG